MNLIYCPRCQSKDMVEITDGLYKCSSCGYAGPLQMDKDIKKF